MLGMIVQSECQTRHVPVQALQMLLDQHYRVPMPIDSGLRTPDVQRLAEIMKEGRRAIGWTQEDLVEESGVSLATVKRYENGKATDPDPDLLLQIFRALNLDRREIPVILGLVSRAEMALPPEPVRLLSPATQQIIDLLEDPQVSTAEKQAIVELLRARRRTPPPDAPGESRKAG